MTLDRYLEAATRENTRRSYASALRHFEVEWGGHLPATSDSVARYLADHATQLANTTLRQRLAALAHWHREHGFVDPTRAPLVRRVLKGIQTLHPSIENQAEPLQLARLAQVDDWLATAIEAAREHGDRANELRHLRDRSLILLGFWRGFRGDELIRVQVEHLRLSQLVEQTRARSEQIGADIAEIEAQLADLQERRVLAEAGFEELDMQLADTQERHAQLDERVIEAERQLNECREQQRRLERQAQEATFSQRSLEARRAELARTLDTASSQAAALADERVRAQAELERLSDAAAQGGLQDVLALKAEREAALAAERSAYDGLSAQLRVSDERRVQIERALEPLRARITEFQLKEQAARLGLEQYGTLLQEAQADMAALAQSITDGNVRVAGLQGEMDRLRQAITALGAVNLAALDELAAARERKSFLDMQMADLTEAMHTLEDAIRKIDAETRELLSGTFDAVNRHFGRMFPELFGGGNARLIVTGDEILDSGVQVMAQPPGKKNQTIHLLSGGEKALTAIALVFAIFQLNPAPFCLLDEVDAPLDDANTERYAKLVSSMSKETQFLFISHNKIAMEMAEQLIGVTMQEQGVSRIVAVDMESALSMADAA